MKVEITLTGANELSAKFKAVADAAADLRTVGVWFEVANEFRKLEKEVFASEGGSSASGKWKALSTEYAARKLKKWGPVPILQASGKLYRSMSIRGAEGSVYEESAQSLTIGTTLPYAGYHQTGGKQLPRRAMVDFTEEQTKRLGEPIKAKLLQVASKAKLRDIRGF
jgi:phage gpG-like protein